MGLTKTKIPYLDRAWPIVTGCSGKGCKAHCWARGMAKRFDQIFRPTFHPPRLDDPKRVGGSLVIGVAFTDDLFDEEITDEQIASVFEVMAAYPQHTFIMLTKQAERMAGWFIKDGLGGMAPRLVEGNEPSHPWPLPNVWLGVSVCDQTDAEERIPWLLSCPAAHRWVSIEPMLGPVRLDRLQDDELGASWNGLAMDAKIDLMMVGGESGSGFRGLALEWVCSARDQCKEAKVMFHFKQDAGVYAEPLPVLDGRRYSDLPWKLKEPK